MMQWKAAHRWGMAIALVGSMSASMSAVLAQDGAAPTPAVEAPAPPPAVEVKVLQAVIMDVKGKAEWRPNEADAAWRLAKVDDLLDPGAQIRTGRKSSVTLRVGLNATVTVAAMSHVSLPEVVQDGDTLRTRAGIKRGRADIKVDKVGLNNDFQVVTPSSVLAVRSTYFSAFWGALKGVEVDSFDGNAMRAIEARYFDTALRFYLDARSKSTERAPDPAVAALFDTIGPPPILGQPLTPALLEQVAQYATTIDRFLEDQRRIEQSPSAAEIERGLLSEEEFAEFVDEFEDQLGDFEFLLAMFFCENQQSFMSEFFAQLDAAGIFDQAAGDSASSSALDDFFALDSFLLKFCESFEAAGVEFPFTQIAFEFVDYCKSLSEPTQVEACLDIVDQLLEDLANESGVTLPPES